MNSVGLRRLVGCDECLMALAAYPLTSMAPLESSNGRLPASWQPVGVGIRQGTVSLYCRSILRFYLRERAALPKATGPRPAPATSSSL
jgi:hypothetical protein